VARASRVTGSKATTAGIAGDEHDEIRVLFSLIATGLISLVLAFAKANPRAVIEIVYESGLLFVSGCRSVAGGVAGRPFSDPAQSPIDYWDYLAGRTPWRSRAIRAAEGVLPRREIAEILYALRSCHGHCASGRKRSAESRMQSLKAQLPIDFIGAARGESPMITFSVRLPARQRNRSGSRRGRLWRAKCIGIGWHCARRKSWAHPSPTPT